MPPQTMNPSIQHTGSNSAFARKAVGRIDYRPLILIMIIALGLRILWMASNAVVISGEGAEYVRMAQNLVAGNGLTGNFEGPETMYAPFFSVLTAGLDLLVKDAELAAHIITLIFGTVLIVPLFFITRRMYGDHVAFLGAALVAFHPLFIALSGSIYNEDVYIPLLLAGVYFGMSSLESRRNRDFVLLSVCLSLAYVCRPEAFAYPVFFAAALWTGAVLGRVPIREAARGSAVILVTFLLFAAPYIGFLYAKTGQLRLEGKWNINYTIAYRLRSGMSFNEATSGLGPDSSVAGPELEPFRFASQTPCPHSSADKARTMLASAKRNREATLRLLRDSAFGGSLPLVLVIIGLFRKSWNRRRLFHEAIVACMVISVLFLVLTGPEASFRFILPLVPFGVIWTAKGIEELGQWTRGLVCSIKGRFLPSPQRASLVVKVISLLLIFAAPFVGTRANWFFVSEQESFADVKKAGIWLNNLSPGPKRIAAATTVFPYYAQGTLVGLPFAEPAQALRYIDSKNVDFIEVDSHFASDYPEVADWLKHGIQDNRAQPIYEAGTSASKKIIVYRWEKPVRSH